MGQAPRQPRVAAARRGGLEQHLFFHPTARSLWGLQAPAGALELQPEEGVLQRVVRADAVCGSVLEHALEQVCSEGERQAHGVRACQGRVQPRRQAPQPARVAPQP